MSGERVEPTAALLLSIVRDTAAELQHRDAGSLHVTPSSALDRDLGLDSLARVELIARIERAFGATLPDDTLETARTPADLLAALARSASHGHASYAPRLPPSAAPPGDEAAPADAGTLLETLDWHVQRHGDRVHVRVLADGGEQAITYAQLHAGASRVAAGLQKRAIERGHTVALMLPTSPEYFHVFMGVLMAGAVPVPIYPPARADQIEEHVRRHAGILGNAGVAMLVSSGEVLGAARLLEAHLPARARVVTARELREAAAPAAPTAARPDDIAFIQYTSGSTGDPKGVVLTHANLLANIRAMAQAVQATAGDVFVSWLPLYHDMGLIGAWLGSLYVGFPLVVMSPLAFLARPARWLAAITDYRGTLSAAPNFAYELCARRIGEPDLARLDLSSWRLAFNGAEAVSADTIARFSERFGARWFAPSAMTPVYGLAESSVELLFPPLGRGPLVDAVDRAALVRDGAARPAAPDGIPPLRFVSCGRALPGHRVRIVDDDAREVGERIEGRLEFAGPSATRGYYRNAPATQALVRGDWLDTGDRAYAAGGEIYVTGRVKDIVIRAGRHLYPDEIEAAIGELDGVRKGCVAAFGSRDPARGTERLVVLAETRETDASARASLSSAIGSAVTTLIGEPPDEIVLAAPHTVLKTSSGKIRRAASRALYESGRIGQRRRAAAMQLAALTAHALGPRLRRGFARAAVVGYGLYAGGLLVTIATVTWLATACLRSRERAWKLGGVAARLFFRLARIPLNVKGIENLSPATPAVLVANHSSYLDGVALIAALSRPCRFVAKRELGRGVVAGTYLRRIGALFIERFDAAQSVRDAERIADAARAGDSVACFPEGTFTRASGLAAFHLGAFHAAARAGAAVVPVAIQGSRSVLRADDVLPRRGSITVTIAAPIGPEPGGNAFERALRLRDAARSAILARCGDPDAVP